MIGLSPLRVGPRREGALIGRQDTLYIPGVDQDSKSFVYLPSTSAQIASVQTAAGVPTGGVTDIWLFQDSSGAVAGVNGINLSTGGTAASYRQTVPGWSHLGISGADAATTSFSSTSASLPDPTTTSYLFLFYVYLTSAPAAQRIWFTYGTTLPQFGVIGLSSGIPILRFQSGGSLNGTHDLRGVVHPIWIQYYVASDSVGPRGAAVSDQDILSTTKRASVSKNLVLNLSFPGVITYGMLITGSQAQLNNAQLRAFEAALGWQANI